MHFPNDTGIKSLLHLVCRAFSSTTLNAHSLSIYYPCKLTGSLSDPKLTFLFCQMRSGESRISITHVIMYNCYPINFGVFAVAKGHSRSLVVFTSYSSSSPNAFKCFGFLLKFLSLEYENTKTMSSRFFSPPCSVYTTVGAAVLFSVHFHSRARAFLFQPLQKFFPTLFQTSVCQQSCSHSKLFSKQCMVLTLRWKRRAGIILAGWYHTASFLNGTENLTFSRSQRCQKMTFVHSIT